ncbi:MAG: 4Fe-4S dicluster domain-containing protein [Candidatus Bathyarchaeia archaeon]
MALQDNSDLTKKIIEMSGQNIFSCNLCGKCTAGCPIANVMDIKPHQVVRLAGIQAEILLTSRAIWLCACCLACVSRCPKQIDIPKIMESFRTLILSRGADFLEYTPDLSTQLPVQSMVAARSRYTSVNLPSVRPSMRLEKYFTRERILALVKGELRK